MAYNLLTHLDQVHESGFKLWVAGAAEVRKSCDGRGSPLVAEEVSGGRLKLKERRPDEGMDER